MSDRFRVSGPARLVAGLLLIGLSLGLIALGSGLEWGVAWTTWLPAVLLLAPALALTRQRTLVVVDGALRIDEGWPRRRSWSIPLADLELEELPTAGLRAVLLHRAGVEHALGTWLTPARAAALLAWLDRAAPEGRWPRRDPPRNAADR